MGVVYRARDPRLQREIAIKVLPPRFARSPSWLARFRREAQLLAAVNHPNIATIHSLESDGDVQFLTMELVPGEPLSDRIARGPLPIGEVLAIGRQIAAALEAAHKRGVIHRDLKPLNVRVAPDGSAKVLDFGLAKVVDRPSDADAEEAASSTEWDEGDPGSLDATLPGSLLGTPGYMSPEQARGENADERSDVWAFGSTIFECLTGRSPVPGSSSTERLAAMSDLTVDWDALPAETPPPLRWVLERALTADKGARLATCTEARQAIEEEIARRTFASVGVREVERRPGAPSNLPRQLSSFIGREREISETARLVLDNPLVTLVGAGGSGKTRLAFEVARRLPASFPDGVLWVELASIADATRVPQALAGALGLTDQPGRHVTDVIVDHLTGKALLLLFDNCEHLVAACGDLIYAVLGSSANLRVLVTSREALGVTGEHIYHVPPLALPDDAALSLEALLENESVRLFVERARTARPGFTLAEASASAVVRICRRLDGIPLAIELAAARAKALPVEEIADRLGARFRLLTGGTRTALPHHQTLRALIDWSHDHLAEKERTLFRRLSVFSGGWTLDAGETICAGDGVEEWEILDLITHLVDKSLVEMDLDRGEELGRARYRTLETIREYARDRLAEAEEEAAYRARHRSHFLGLAQVADAKLTGPEQATWLRRLASEHENLRAALSTDGAGADVPASLRLAGVLGRYWYMRSRWSEGRKVYADLFGRLGAPGGTADEANALNWAGILAKLQGDYAQAKSHLERSLEIRRALNDPVAVAASLNNLGTVVKDEGDLARARRLHEESLAIRRRVGDRDAISVSLHNLGLVAQLQEDYPGARAFLEESLAICRDVGDRSGVAASLSNLGVLAEAHGDRVEALAYLQECLAIRRDIGDRWGAAVALHNLARLEEDRDAYDAARGFYEDSLSILRDIGDRSGTMSSLQKLGMLAEKRGDVTEAASCYRESLTIARELNDRARMASLLSSFGVLAATVGDIGRAARLLAAAESAREEIGARPSPEEHGPIEDAKAKLRREMGEVAFATHWEAGRALSTQAAVLVALLNPESP
jgi:non-specific serine/threonine protein kinase